MKCMLLIYFEEKAGFSETERENCYKESMELAHQLRKNGQYLAANP